MESMYLIYQNLTKTHENGKVKSAIKYIKGCKTIVWNKCDILCWIDNNIESTESSDFLWQLCL